MRIIIVVDTFPSVSETFISNKVRFLTERGHEVIVCCVHKNEQLFRLLFDGNSKVKPYLFTKTASLFFVLVHPFEIVKSLRSTRLRQRLYRRYRMHILQKFNSDIIHFEFSGLGIDFLYEIKHLPHSKKLVSCRGSAEKVKLHTHMERREKFRQLLTETDAIHCVSDDMRQTILPYCPHPEKIFVNYPSIDTSYFQRSEPLLKQGKIIILSVGRLTFQKGYESGLLAVAQLKQRGHQFKWRIIGNGPDYESIIFRISLLGLENEVELLGAQNSASIKQQMEDADIFFLPSLYEGIANVVLEAMSMQLPVVVTRSGGMEEVITQGENGLLADVFDKDAMCLSLEKFILDPVLREKTGRKASRTISEKFNIRRQIDVFESVYRRLSGENLQQQKGYETTEKPAVTDVQERKKLHIGVVVPEFPTLSETFFMNKVAGLCQRGHKVTVFCSTSKEDPSLMQQFSLNRARQLNIVRLNFNEYMLMSIKNIILHPFIFARSFNLKPARFRRNWHYDLCAYHLRKYNCDVYHFGYSGIAVSYMNIFESLPGFKIISCRGTAENVKLISDDDRPIKLKLLFGIANKIHCVSEHMAGNMMHYGAEKEKIFINHPAIDTTYFERAQPYASSEHIVILTIGRLVFQKGYLPGLMAIQRLSKSFEHFTWIIAGDGPEMEEIKLHINKLGLSHFVELKGKQNKDQVKKLYERADIYLQPSVTEGMANAVLEAMSMSIPVISSDTGGMPEAVKHNENGLLFRNYNIEEMAAALLSLCIDFERRKQLGEGGRRTALENFKIERYIDVFEQQYYSLMQSGGK